MTEERQISFAQLISAAAMAVGRIAEIVEDALLNPSRLILLLRELGWDIPYNTGVTGTELTISSAASALKDAISGDNLDILAILQGIQDVLDARTSLVSELGLAVEANIQAALAEQFPRQILDHALVRFLQDDFPTLYGVLYATGVIVQEYSPPDADYRLGYIKRQVRWDVLTSMITQPAMFFELAYGWGTPEFRAAALLDGIETLLLEFGLDVGRVENPTAGQEFTSAIAEPVRINLIDWDDMHMGLDCFILGSRESTNAQGFAIAPHLIGEAEINVPISNSLELRLAATSLASPGIGFKIVPDDGITFFTNTGTGTLTGGARIEVSICPDGGIGRLGDKNGPRIEVSSIDIVLQAAMDQGNLELGVEVCLRDIEMILSTEGADGFLARILGGLQVGAGFSLSLGWASRRGLYLQGNGALELSIPVHKKLGPFSLDEVYLSISVVDGRLPVVAAVSLVAQLGPVVAAVERLGFVIRAPIANGTQIKDIEFGFLPPTGAGIAIEAGPIVGGGFLEFDQDNKRYAGVLQLKMGEIGLTAIGLITTRMPDGSDGFAMLVSIGVEFTPVIQLSFGFTLGAVGGLIGINRTMMLDVLRVGVRNRTLDSILFPQDPIANASKIISDLRSVFPPEEDRFVIGPMLRIGWGSPSIITAELAVIIELPNPVRIVILGQFAAAFPEEEAALVELHLDVLGVIDFGKKTLSIDASLYDSHVIGISLSGDAAFRLNWGKPEFGLSLGGFHPRFSPPPNFPVLRRLRLSIGAGNNPRIICEEYKALTSNSLQFGAFAELYIKFSAVKIHGYMGFDALFYFSPFGFDVAIKAGVSIRVAGVNLLSIRLYFQLSGPRPWHAEGEATVEILWWEISVHFDVTWGRREPEEIPAVNPWNDFITALNRQESWGTTLPAGRAMVESLRSVEHEESGGEATDTSGEGQEQQLAPLLAHPAGTLEVRQKVLPLEMHLYMYGNAPISGHHTYHISIDFQLSDEVKNAFGLSQEEAGTVAVFELPPLYDYFARGQYERLSNGDKVSKPSYERFQNGRALRSKIVGFNDNLTEEYPLKYESEYIDDDNVTKKASGEKAELAVIAGAVGWRLLRGAASRKNTLRTTGLGKYSTKGKNTKVSVSDESYTIVRSNDMSAVAEIEGNDGSMTRMTADQTLRESVEAQQELVGELLVVPSYEVAA